jgi:hypothetical protein
MALLSIHQSQAFQSNRSSMIGSRSTVQQQSSSSQSIAISRQCPVLKDNFYEADTNSSFHESSYDLATWRMYNRIVDYRMQHPISPNYYHTYDQSSEQRQSIVDQTGKYTPVPLSFTQQPVQLVSSNIDQYDGEVFEMDI